MDKRLLELLVCPLCKGPLRLVAEGGETGLVCRADRLAYAVRDGVPMMLPDDAQLLEPGDARLER